MRYRKKNFRTSLLHWLLQGGRWCSPYHGIAYDLAHKPSKRTIYKLLDCGFVTRASHLLRNASLATPASLAKLAFLKGEPERAINHLWPAFQKMQVGSTEYKRAIKLLTRLMPEKLADWAHVSGNVRLNVQLRSAITPSLGYLLQKEEPKGDELLLIANSRSSSQEKLPYLNKYLQEMGLDPINLKSTDNILDINNLAPTKKNPLSPRASEISVIMTVCNGATYIRAAALSILLQKEVFTELIIVDDGSDDDTWSIVCSIKNEYPGRVHCIQLPNNVGTYRAKNIALKLCTKEFVAFQDADDWSHPQRLAKAVSWLKISPKHVAATCRYTRISPASLFHSPAVWPIRQWSPNTLVFKRQPITSVIGGFDGTRFGADTDYFERIRASFGDNSISLQPEPMLFAMSLPLSLMHNTATGINEIGHSTARTAYREYCAERILRAIQQNASLFFP